MPDIRPFRGLRYALSLVKRLADVVAPPYDIISPRQQRALHARHPYNVVRLELGRVRPGDDASDNRYARAARCLEDWIARGVLRREDREAIYVYAQDYREAGRLVTRVGFLAAMKIDEKAVLKHENTLAKPKQDRLALLKATRANLSPIFGLFDDRSGAVGRLLRRACAGRPDAQVSADGVRHRLHAVTDPALIRRLVAALRSKPMYIADGHHRFEVACQYRRLQRSRGRGGWDRVLTYLADWRHEPFTIYPTHRLVRAADPSRAKRLLESAGTFETVSTLASMLGRLEKRAAAPRAGRYSFGVFTRAEGFRILTLKPSGTRRDPVSRLDVAVLHRHLIEPVYGIRQIAKSESIDFTRDAREAVSAVRSGRFHAAFFLPSTSLAQMIEVSRRGLKMPQKSTYFYPKLLTGMVIRRLEGERP